VPDDGNRTAALDQRVPQASEGARTDRRMSWAGMLTPAEPTQDVELIERVHHGLQNYEDHQR